MKKFVVMLMAVCLLFAATACNGTANEAGGDDEFKIGIILLHNETVGYDKNFIDAIEAAAAELGLKDSQIIYKKDIPEDAKCYDACVELAEEGCDVIFADSFSHEEHVIKAAKEYPNIQFLHATGQNAVIENLPNFHTAFANIYEGRYLAGVTAGLKLNQLIADGTITAEQAKIGYVGAWPFAEVISGYTSFFLGARSICPSATMRVTYTSSWADYAKEKEAANKLINENCVIISEHADTNGSPEACEEAMKNGKIAYHVGYNIDFTSVAPTANLVSSKINWTPYFVYAFGSAMKGEAIDVDWCAGLEKGSVLLMGYNDANVTAEMKTEIDAISQKIQSGEIKVFDTSTFTVTNTAVLEANFIFPDMYKVDEEGHLIEYMADAVADSAYTPDTQVIKDGCFQESTVRSAPYFNVIIDGVTLDKTE